MEVRAPKFLLPRGRLNVGKQVEEVDVRARCVKGQGAIQACIHLLVECTVGGTSYPVDGCSHSFRSDCAVITRSITLSISLDRRSTVGKDVNSAYGL